MNEKITAEQIIDSWSASAHMASAIEYLHDACVTGFIATQIQNMESSIASIKQGMERLKGDKVKHQAANSAIKVLRSEISRLRKKLQRGVRVETPAERTKKPVPALEKELKRVHKGVKKEKKETKKDAKKAKKLLGKLEKTGTTHGVIEQAFLSNPGLRKANEQLEKFAKESGPVVAAAGKKLTDAFVEGIKKVKVPPKLIANTATPEKLVSKPKAPKKSGKKGKK